MWAGVKLEVKAGEVQERSGGEAGKVSPEGEEGLLMLPSPSRLHHGCLTPHSGSKWATWGHTVCQSICVFNNSRLYSKTIKLSS